MPEFTGIYNLYKWRKSDQKQLTMDEMANNSDKIENAFTGVKNLIGPMTTLGSTARNVVSNISEWGLNIKDFGITGNGDYSAAFTAMFSAAANLGLKSAFIPAGRYGVSETIVLPAGFTLKLDPNAEIYPRANVNVIQMKPKATISGGIIDLKFTTFVFDKAAIFLDATDMFQLYEQAHLIENINIYGAPKTSGWKGTGILMTAMLPDTYINSVKMNNITMTNIGVGIQKTVNPALTDPAHPSWINACTGSQITMMNFEYGFKFEGLNNVPRDVGGNLYTQLQLQAEIGTKHMIYCESALNRFDGFFWDLHKMIDTNQAFRFTAGSRFNEVKSAMASELTESWWDEGYMNSFPSPNSYTADKRINAMPVSTPGYPNFLGDQDDYMIYGDGRGYTLTKTAGPTVTGLLTDLLQPDTENGIEATLTGTTSTTALVIEIDMTSNPCSYSSFLTAIFQKGYEARNVELTMCDGSTWGDPHLVIENRSQNIVVSAAWISATNCTKVRIKMWGANAANGKVRLARIMMTSQKDPGKAFLPYNYTPPVVIPDIPPTIPGKIEMIGDQDDILVMADKKYSIASTGAVKTSGELAYMFSMKKAKFCKWADAPSISPIVLTIDFGANGVDYLESAGLTFSEGEIARNIKIERVIGNAANPWEQSLDKNGNTSHVVHAPTRAPKTYKLRFTISVAAVSANGIRINRIFATVADQLPGAFVSIEGGGQVYNDIEIMDATKGIIMKTPDGTKRFRITIDNNGDFVKTQL